MLKLILSHLTVTNALLSLFAVYLLRTLIHNTLESRRIRRLGARAPVRRTYLPLGLDFLYGAITSALADRNYEFWLGVFTKYGNPANPWTVEVGKGAARLVLTADPENIKALLATQFKDYGKGANFNKDWHDFLGDGIFTTDGDRWHNSRQLIRPQFIKDRLSDLDIFEKHFNVLVTKLGGKGEVVDIVDLFFRYTLDAATDFLLGRSVDSLENPQAEFAHAFAEAQRVQSLIARMGPINWVLPRKALFDSVKVVDDFVSPYIEDALRLPPDELEKKMKGDSGYTFLHALAAYTRDRVALRDQLVAVLIAGRDTTACTLSWVMYQLSIHPHIVQKLRQEILQYVGLERLPTYDDLKSMKYLQHILNETLRLYPVLPFNVRLALHDTTLPHGGGPDGNEPIGILKDTPISYATIIMQRRGDLYPPVASGFPSVDQFVPERWDGWTPKSWTYIPFNGGPRICIGQQFAMTEMAYTIVRLFQRFGTIETRMDGEDPGMHCDIVLQPAKVVKVAFLDAAEGLGQQGVGGKV